MSNFSEIYQAFDELCEKYMRIINLQQKRINIMTIHEAKLMDALSEANARIEHLENIKGEPSPECVITRINYGHGEMHISAKGTLAMKELAERIKDFIETKGVAAAIEILKKYS